MGFWRCSKSAVGRRQLSATCLRVTKTPSKVSEAFLYTHELRCTDGATVVHMVCFIKKQSHVTSFKTKF